MASLSLTALERLQFAAKIHLFRSIGAEWQQFADLPEIGLPSESRKLLQQPLTSSEECGKIVVESWLKKCGIATWKSLLNLLESSQQLETVASAINQYFSAATLEERVYQLEQSQKEILQRENEALQKQKMMEKEIEELKSRLKMYEPLLQDLKQMKGSEKRGEWYSGGSIIMCGTCCTTCTIIIGLIFFLIKPSFFCLVSDFRS